MPNLERQTLRERYRIEELIGRGGMAEVYKAWDLRRQHHVAIKVMRADLADDLEFLRRFKREAEALSALSHENIVRFHSFERDGHLAFIVMDYVEGTTLQRRIREAEGQPLPLGEVLLIAKQVCAALHYAHSENVLHRDVKPGNIMLRADGTVLVADFGIAKAADSATVTTVMPGTPAYMSPEQCRSEPLDARADLYSLGILIYEMLAGRRPFVGETQAVTGSTREKIRWEQLHADPPRLRAFNPEVPRGVDVIVRMALAKERDARWPTVQDFWEMLVEGAGVPERDWVAARVPVRREAPPVRDNREVLAEEADVRERGWVAAPSPPVPEAVHQLPGRIKIPPWGWALLGVALVALILIISGALSGGGRPTPEPVRIVEREATVAPPEVIVETVVVEREVTVDPPEVIVETVVVEREVTVDPPEVIVETVVVEREVTVDPPEVIVVPQTDSDMRFVVVYPQSDGLSMRTGPDTSDREIAVLYAGTELEVTGSPVGSGSLRWWPVSSAFGAGWVAEWYGEWRLVKPVFGPGEVIQVFNPQSTGNVNLRNSNCDAVRILSRGTRLTVLDGPATKCDSAGSAIVQQGRRWWYIETADGATGWMADFSQDSDKRMLIAPQWYVELAAYAPFDR